MNHDIMTMVLRSLATAFLIYLRVAGAGANEGGASASRQLQVGSDPSILAIIASYTELTTLFAAVTATGMDQDLIDLPLTALAPSNAGFAALDLDLFNNLLLTPAWELHLVEILEYHLSSNPVFTFTLQNGSEITMRNGEIVFVKTPSGVGNTYTFSNSKDEGVTLTQADIFADNGVVHITDNVLRPSFFYRSVIDLFGGSYSTLQNLALIAGLEGYLSEGPFTLFAPTNNAFNLLPAATISFLSSPAGNIDLVEILQYHTVEAVFPSTILANGIDLSTAQGNIISIGIVGGTITANYATVIDADILALNGITHGIDRVLMIPEGTGQPSTGQPSTGQPTSAPVGPSETTDPTIYMLAADNPDLSTLTSALNTETSGLDAVLNDPTATLTALGPTNAAFDALPSGLLSTLLTAAFSQHLTELLLYHASEDVFRSADLFNGDVITMLNGETVTYAISNAGVATFNQARIEIGDIEARNGVVYVIGQVLLPSFASRTVIDLESDYSTWLTLIELADLATTFRGGAWTLFAPTNAAFDKIDQETLSFLTSAAGKDNLIEILNYHAVPQVLTSEKLNNGDKLTTAQGDIIAIRVFNNQGKVNNANAVTLDILAINGVTHGIDTVLTPPTSTETLAPTSAPTSASPTLLPTQSPTLLPTLSPTQSPTSAAGVLGSSLLGLLVMVLLTAAW
jgi:transforming growth factor-beta-induced protein